MDAPGFATLVQRLINKDPSKRPSLSHAKDLIIISLAFHADNIKQVTEEIKSNELTHAELIDIFGSHEKLAEFIAQPKDEIPKLDEQTVSKMAKIIERFLKRDTRTFDDLYREAHEAYA